MTNEEFIRQLKCKVTDLLNKAGEASDYCKDRGFNLEREGYLIELNAYRKVVRVIEELEKELE